MGALIGDPARANMLTALMSGKALTATELAGEAGITPQTASTHLARLEDAGLVSRSKQGRHRYFNLADDEVGVVLESLMGLAASRGHLRTRTGPKDPEMRKARICYDHLAGEMGVQMLDSMKARDLIHADQEFPDLTDAGRLIMSGLDIDLENLGKARRPLCRICLDWSARRSHLAGALGTALLNRFYDLGWARRVDGTRIVRFSPTGQKRFAELFPV